MNTKPPYFEEIAGNAARRWDQLEADVELAGPWRQLFNQVQSPRHVLSEMLQNADDAGASCVRVSATDGVFVFEHDGRDFEESEFASLCRFGYSNKRSLHTIGFRGIGFKSLFSLGKTVKLFTPTLAVKFCADRFTQPHWIESAQLYARTRIEVHIEDENRLRELQKNFEQWRSSPLSLLFFGSIERLQIEDHDIYKETLGPGPRPGSQWVALKGSNYHRLLHVRSPEEQFPTEAIDEIKKERNADELNLPPCRVELVVGNQDRSRLFVVLPTDVAPNLPFSAHAPFLQDPARVGIKSPATSPTNRWLLDRVGRLAATTMCDWLAKPELPVENRAGAYALLPPPGADGDTLDASVTEHVSLGFRAACHDSSSVLLLERGELAAANQAVIVPPDLLDAWPESVLSKIFGFEGKRCLSRAILDGHKHQLQAWNWIRSLSDRQFIDALLASEETPRPEGARQIAALWSFVLRSNYPRYNPAWRSEARIVPVEATDHLCSANETVRLSSRRSDVPETEWQFLASFVHVIDGGWLHSLREAVNDTSGNAADNKRFADAAALLKQIGLDAPTSVDRLMERACNAALHHSKASRNLLVRLAHIFAAFDASVPADFRYVNHDDRPVAVTDGVMLDLDDQLKEIFPENFCRQRIIHNDYQQNLAACTSTQWRTWAMSSKSRLSTFSVLKDCYQYFYTRDEFEAHLQSLGVNPPTEYQYRTGQFQINDREIAPEVFVHLCKEESEHPDCWATLVRNLLSGPTEHWQANQHAAVRETASNGYSRKAKIDNVPAKWIRQLAEKPCLIDTHGRHRVPADLLLRTPDTEPFMAIEAFVAAEIDTPQNRPLLLLLGARDTPTGTDRLVSRVRALAACEKPPLHELFRWYEVLDGAAARAQPQELAELRKEFANSRLIFTNSNQWSTSSEVFCFADRDTMPDAATIHEGVEELPLWKRLGVPDRPTLPLIIDWLAELEPGSKLDAQAARRVQACLKAFPAQIYDQVNAWLSLDNHWLPIDQFRYKHHSGSNLRISDFFVAAKSRTADLRGVPNDRLGESRFACVPELSTEISYVASEVLHSATAAHVPDWLVTLGGCLARFTHESAEVQERVRRHGTRLAKTSWQEVVSIKVTPYLDGTPVGQPQRPSCLWTDRTLYIASPSLVAIIDALADELQQPFDLPAIAEAIRICIDRRSEFTQQYLAEKFDLQPMPNPEADLEQDPGSAEPAAGVTSSTATGGQPDHDQGGRSAERSSDRMADATSTASPPFGQPSVEDSGETDSGAHPVLARVATEKTSNFDTDTGSSRSSSAEQPSGEAHGEPRPTSAESSRESSDRSGNTGPLSSASEAPPHEQPTSDARDPKQVELRHSMLERFAQSRGFTYDETRRAYYAEDGSRMLRCGGMFTCEIYSPSRPLPCRVWISPQSLAAGLEVPAEVWEMIRANPDATAIVHEGPGEQVAHSSGSELLQMVADEAIRLFPAKYRIRQIAR